MIFLWLIIKYGIFVPVCKICTELRTMRVNSTIENNRFFTIGQSDAFLSHYLTDLKLHRTK